MWFDTSLIGDIMDTHQDIWDTTYRRDSVAGIRCMSLTTVVSEHTPGERKLKAEVEIHTWGIGINDNVSVAATVRMTPAQMRALADLLHIHADRIEQELIPLLTPPAPVSLPTEPTPLYHEPEAA